MIAVAAAVAAAAAFLVTAAGATLVFRRRLALLHEELRRTRELANLDPLTGLYNRRYFQDVLGRELARSRRYERSLALLLLDLDDFKTVKDRVGHLAGDAVLAQAAACVRAVVRGADVACRIGGDELAVILPEASAADAEAIYHRLQEALAEQPVEGIELSASGGVAEAGVEDDADAFVGRADTALYAAKATGKRSIVRA
jgi:diguanylate cyclase (GGDEF)-like protein